MLSGLLPFLRTVQNTRANTCVIRSTVWYMLCYRLLEVARNEFLRGRLSICYPQDVQITHVSCWSISAELSLPDVPMMANTEDSAEVRLPYLRKVMSGAQIIVSEDSVLHVVAQLIDPDREREDDQETNDSSFT